MSCLNLLLGVVQKGRGMGHVSQSATVKERQREGRRQEEGSLDSTDREGEGGGRVPISRSVGRSIHRRGKVV